MLQFEREIISPIVDALIAFGILYLFYSLGIKKVKAESNLRAGIDSFKLARSKYNKRPGDG